MKLCDKCHCIDAPHQEVGGLVVEIKGFHQNHYTHRGQPWFWNLDLCPKCAGRLKDTLDTVLQDYKETR